MPVSMAPTTNPPKLSKCRKVGRSNPWHLSNVTCTRVHLAISRFVTSKLQLGSRGRSSVNIFYQNCLSVRTSFAFEAFGHYSASTINNKQPQHTSVVTTAIIQLHDQNSEPCQPRTFWSMFRRQRQSKMTTDSRRRQLHIMISDLSHSTNP